MRILSTCTNGPASCALRQFFQLLITLSLGSLLVSCATLEDDYIYGSLGDEDAMKRWNKRHSKGKPAKVREQPPDDAALWGVNPVQENPSTATSTPAPPQQALRDVDSSEQEFQYVVSRAIGRWKVCPEMRNVLQSMQAAELRQLMDENPGKYFSQQYIDQTVQGFANGVLRYDSFTVSRGESNRELLVHLQQWDSDEGYYWQTATVPFDIRKSRASNLEFALFADGELYFEFTEDRLYLHTMVLYPGKHEKVLTLCRD